MKRMLVVATLLFAMTQAGAATQAEVTTNSVGSTGTLTVRDAGKGLWQITTCITSAHMSPDGKYLLTVADGRGYVQLWSTERHERLKTFLAPGHQDRELTAAFTPDSRRLRINSAGDRENFTGYDTSNRFYSPWPESSLWKIDGLKRIAVVVDRKRESSFSRNVQFSADGRRMIFTNGSGPASVFDAFTGRHLQTFMRDDGRGAVEGRFSADGSRATVAYQNGSVIEYDVKRRLVFTVLKPASVP